MTGRVLFPQVPIDPGGLEECAQRVLQGLWALSDLVGKCGGSQRVPGQSLCIPSYYCQGRSIATTLLLRDDAADTIAHWSFREISSNRHPKERSPWQATQLLCTLGCVRNMSGVSSRVTLKCFIWTKANLPEGFRCVQGFIYKSSMTLRSRGHDGLWKF